MFTVISWSFWSYILLVLLVAHPPFYLSSPDSMSSVKQSRVDTGTTRLTPGRFCIHQHGNTTKDVKCLNYQSRCVYDTLLNKAASGMFRFLLLCQLFVFCKQEFIPTGHLQPLGSHRPPEGAIKSVAHVPTPQEFYYEYVLKGQPVIFKGAAKLSPGFQLWSDSYLR